MKKTDLFDKQPARKSLSLNRETVRRLQVADLQRVAGGRPDSDNPWCKPLPSEASNCMTCNHCW